jgi:hypothetical protein
MADARLDQSLQALEAEAQRLAAVSTKTNEIIQRVQHRLKAANIGFEYWLSSKPLQFGEKSSSLWIGYAKIENDWQIVVKVPPSSFEVLANNLAKNPTPLVKARREVRQAALPLLIDLIEALTAEIAKQADNIESVTARLDA